MFLIDLTGDSSRCLSMGPLSYSSDPEVGCSQIKSLTRSKTVILADNPVTTSSQGTRAEESWVEIFNLRVR